MRNGCLWKYLAAPALIIGLAQAQVTVQLRLGKTSFLAGEPVPVEVTVTNLSGQELAFQGNTRTSWIDFIVSSGRGVPMSAIASPAFGAVRIPSGKALVRTVDLSQIYALTELGNHSVYAIVRLPNQGNGGFQSNRHLFTVNSALPYWTQAVGVPGRPGKQNEFRLIKFNSDRKTQLYAQLADARTGRILRTHHLGELLAIRDPAVSVDSSLTMHVLFMINPKFWGHARISPDGRFLGRDLYQPGPTIDPMLAKMTDGSIKPIGGIFYDPKAAAEQQSRNRRASDRPDISGD